MTETQQHRIVAILTIALLMSSCGGARIKDGPPRGGAAIPGDAVPRPEAKSRYGNGPVYEVFGKHYTVMPDSRGYKERGVASWYGKKFHGNLTSNRETYDMYGMTAAHKSLPLPTYVRVRNLRNNKSIIVRVNDRGPFVHNRIIDLSYSAAKKLDMIRDGTSLVEVEAISFDPPGGDRPVRQVTPPDLPTSRADSAPSVADASAPTPATAPEPVDDNRIFVQVGAYGSRENAERRLALLRSGGIGTAFVVEDSSVAPALFRVRVGPIRGVMQYDLLVAELQKLGVDDPYLVTE